MTDKTVYKFKGDMGSMLYAELDLGMPKKGSLRRTIQTVRACAGNEDVPVARIGQFIGDYCLTMRDIVERVKRREMH